MMGSCGVEGALIYDGLVGVLDDLPLVRGAVDLGALVGLLVGPVVHGVAQVLRPGEHLRHRPGGPVVGAIQVRGVELQAVGVHVVGRALYLPLPELVGDDGGAVALEGQGEDLPHHGGGFLVDQQMVLLRRVLFVAVENLVGKGDVRPAPGQVGLLLLAAGVPQIPLVHDVGVPQIPLVHDVEEGSKLAALPIRAVHAVGDGDEPDPVLGEEHLRVEAGLQIIPAHPAHVLHQHRRHLPIFDVRHQPLPVRALKVAAGVAVVGVVGAVRETMLRGIVLQHALLHHDGIAVPQLLVVPGQALV